MENVGVPRVFSHVGTYQILIHDCFDFKSLALFESELKRAGAEVTDHKIYFNTQTAKFYIRLKMPDGHTLETFTDRLRESPIWHLTSWASG